MSKKCLWIAAGVVALVFGSAMTFKAVTGQCPCAAMKACFAGHEAKTAPVTTTVVP
jgi:hypothetical protein